MLEYTLLDDGTMDTGIRFHCTRCNQTWGEWFSDTSEYRDEDGDLDLNQFVAELGTCCEMCGDCDFDDDSDCEGGDIDDGRYEPSDEESGSHKTGCTRCDGTGLVANYSNPASEDSYMPCPDCDGSGEVE